MPRVIPSSPRSGFIEPCLPSSAERPPAGPDWVHEIKHDGYRLMARRDSVGIRLLMQRPRLVAAISCDRPGCRRPASPLLTDRRRGGGRAFDLQRPGSPAVSVSAEEDPDRHRRVAAPLMARQGLLGEW